MSKETETVKPTVRRGISNNTRAVAWLKFHEKDAAQNGLFIGHLEEVTVEWSTNEGVKTPRLQFHFASNHSNPDERRHVTQSLFPVESTVDTIPGGKDEWKVNNVFRFIKHILDVFYLKGKELTEAEETALSLPFVDYDDEGNYIPTEPDTVLDGYGALFTNAAAILNGTFGGDKEATGKPCYKDANGKPISIWMKLLRHKKRKDSWVNVAPNGELAFDTFIGSGIIEIQKPNTPPAVLRIDTARESITPKEVNKTPSIGGMIPGGGVMVGTPVDFGSQNGAFSEAGVDMPF